MAKIDVEDPRGHVGRPAFLAGLLAGGAVVIVGFYVVPALDLGRLASLPLELATVAAALWVTTGIWRWSAALKRPTLDTPSTEQDRGEEP